MTYSRICHKNVLQVKSPVSQSDSLILAKSRLTLPVTWCRTCLWGLEARRSFHGRCKGSLVAVVMVTPKTQSVRCTLNADLEYESKGRSWTPNLLCPTLLCFTSSSQIVPVQKPLQTSSSTFYYENTSSCAKTSWSLNKCLKNTLKNHLDKISVSSFPEVRNLDLLFTLKSRGC